MIQKLGLFFMEGMNNKLGKLNKVELKDKEVEPM